jgi:hypothetical protein
MESEVKVEMEPEIEVKLTPIEEEQELVPKQPSEEFINPEDSLGWEEELSSTMKVLGGGKVEFADAELPPEFMEDEFEEVDS